MKTIICTIGNRDLQFDVNKNTGDLSEYLIKNNDAPEYLIIKKSDYNLYELTERIYHNYDHYREIVAFPLIEKALANIHGNSKRLVLITTNQNPSDKQDTYFIALTAQKYFQEKGYNSEINIIDFNPTDFNKLFTLFSNIFDNYTNDELFCANSGGTPQMKTASEFAGIFRNIQYITINARSETSLSNFKNQERIVLKHTIERMLEVFAYEGVALLPVIPECVKNLCEIALALLSLDFKTAKKISEKLDGNLDENLLTILKESKDNIDITKKMYLSAKIKFFQKSYGDYLWRLFSIHDNIFIPYVEKFFESKIKYCEEDNHSEWNNLLRSRSDLTEHLEDCVVGFKNEKLNYNIPNKYVYFEILKFANKSNTDFINQEQFEKLKKIHENLNRLGIIRNAIAHSLKGVNIKDIEKKLQKTSIDEFNNLLADYFKIPNDDYCEFNLINKEILKALY